MPTGKVWLEHFKHLKPQRIARMRGALKTLLEDSMFKEHYTEFYTVDGLLKTVQWERQVNKGRYRGKDGKYWRMQDG
jgi:hypothetical protein